MTTSDSTTYCIYRIVCFPTGRVYVGQTIDVNRRKKTHFQLLKSGKHTNRKLQSSFNKWGQKHFFFEVLEYCVSQDTANEREKHWIAFYDSVRKGYNLTEGGNDGTHLGRKCIWNGIEYVSTADAARANNVEKVTLTRWLKKGYTCLADVKPYKKDRRCVWNGITYPSVKEAAAALGLSPDGLYGRLYKGYKCDSDVPRRKKVFKVEQQK